MPQTGIPVDAEYVRLGDLLRELPEAVADILIDPVDPLASVARPQVVLEWKQALRDAVASGELRGNMLSASKPLYGGMHEQVSVQSISEFLTKRRFDVVSTPAVTSRGESGVRVVLTTRSSRREALAPIIEQAQATCMNPRDPAQV